MAHGPMLATWTATTLERAARRPPSPVAPARRSLPSRTVLFVAAVAIVAVLTAASSAVAVSGPTPQPAAAMSGTDSATASGSTEKHVTAQADTDASPWALAVIASGICGGVVLAIARAPNRPGAGRTALNP